MRLTHLTLMGVLVGAVIAALLAPLGCLFAREAGRDAMGRLTATATVAGSRVSDALRSVGAERTATRRTPERLEQLLAGMSHGRGTELSVLLPDGRIVTTGDRHLVGKVIGRLPRRGAAAIPGLRTAPVPMVPAPGSFLSVRMTVPVGGQSAAVLLVRAPADDLRSDVLLRWAVLVALLPTAVLCCMVPALALHRRSARSVRDIGATLRALSEGAYHTRAETHSHGYHLNELATVVNTLGATVQSAMEEYRTFLADVAHQLRNPMIAMRLRIENLRPYLPAAEAERQTRLLADVDRMDRTLTDLLDHARRLPADRNAQVVDVCDIAEECVRAWAAVAEQRAVRLSLSRPRRAWALARPGAVEQALNVLLDNALKHSPEGGVVRLSIAVTGPRLRIEVSDEGPGLPHADREAALERGWRRGPAASSGIGLSIAAKLIESSGGRLELRTDDAPGLNAVLHLASAAPEWAGSGQADR
ncbi:MULTISPECIES: sensor histidine kinase [Streptomyces]|uniref:sensor histidine kinase n=1 Tax=Streptomyces TaxID=1883 RepID=UPI00292ECF2C|nr:HAMP domain-containing sensor histidine kinase [Streptomyces sp. NEAU-HV9]